MTDDDCAVIRELRSFVFGESPDLTDLTRWRQGLVFDSTTTCVLKQLQGGPCAVLAPLQAHIIHCLQASCTDEMGALSKVMEAGASECDEALVRAMATILTRAALASKRPMVIVLEGGNHVPHHDWNEFHNSLQLLSMDANSEAEVLLHASLSQYQSLNGVILFLYAALLSRGLDEVRADMGMEAEQPLVGRFGHCSQGVVNLMLGGCAVPHVWDGVKDIGEGLLLRGVDEQPEVGFLSVLEALHYCEVGSLLKNPRAPVWVIGSESHFTTLFSTDPCLTSPEPRHHRAKRIFQRYDQEGNGFIATDTLPLVLAELGDVEHQVTDLQSLLDKESAGIILLTDFLNTVARAQVDERHARIPTSFCLYHINNLVDKEGKSNIMAGTATYTGSGEAGGHDLLACLRTKWRGLEVKWEGDKQPSIN